MLNVILHTMLSDRVQELKAGFITLISCTCMLVIIHKHILETEIPGYNKEGPGGFYMCDQSWDILPVLACVKNVSWSLFFWSSAMFLAISQHI